MNFRKRPDGKWEGTTDGETWRELSAYDQLILNSFGAASFRPSVEGGGNFYEDRKSTRLNSSHRFT